MENNLLQIIEENDFENKKEIKKVLSALLINKDESIKQTLDQLTRVAKENPEVIPEFVNNYKKQVTELFQGDYLEKGESGADEFLEKLEKEIQE